MKSEVLQRAREELVFRRGQIEDAIRTLDLLSAETVAVDVGIQIKQEIAPRTGTEAGAPKRKYAKRTEVRAPGKGKGHGSTESRPTVVVPGGGRTGMGRVTGGALASVVRVVVGAMDKEATFTRGQLEELVRKTAPELTSKVYTLGMTLVDMVERGELKRQGTGRGTVYSVGRLLSEKAARPGPVSSPTEKEKQWAAVRGEIHVPRDGAGGES